MPVNPDYGYAKYISAAGATVVSTVNSRLIGILFQASATSAIQIWAGTTATATAAGVALSGVIRAYATTGTATVQPSFYQPFPAYASGGCCVNVTGAGDPSVTLFWCPTGGD